MNKLYLVLCLTVVMLLASCAAGPHQLRRSVDDWDQKLYVDNPLLNGVLWVVPVIPLCHFGAGIGDFFIGDAYHFWGLDLWRGKGTGYRHKEIPADQYLKGLIVDDGGFLKAHTTGSM